ncbi:MAG: NAD-dependent epimerase/dehydratase family protein [Chloroflexota bacterium]
MRVCVVGGTGNISTGIVKALLAFGHDVSVFNRGQRDSRLPEGVRYLHGDRQDRPAFEAAMQRERFDAAIDMISFTANDAASALRAFSGTRHLIHCSTVCTYGGPLLNIPADESEPLRPITDYGRNKVAADAVLMAAHARGDLAVTIMKAASTWGGMPVIRQLAFDPFWIDRVRKHKPIIVTGDGENLWSFCHSDDAGVAFAAAVDRPACKGQDYIITGPRYITWQSYHERINAVLGSRSEIVHVPASTVLAGPLGPRSGLLSSQTQWNQCYDVSKARRDIPEFQPTIELEDRIPENVDWMDRQGMIADSDGDEIEDRVIAAQRRVLL